MRNLTLLFLGLAFCLLRPCSASERVFIFGDSLSDNGNCFALIKFPPPPYGNTFSDRGVITGYFPGRFTDGPNWVDYLPCIAKFLGGDIAAPTPAYPNNLDGTNFAVGGSTSGNVNVIDEHLQSLPNQINDFVTRFGGKSAPDDLCIIWIGANDFGVGIDPAQTVANIKDGIAKLAQAGVRNFAVINIPELALTPKVKALGGATIAAARQFVFTTNVLLEVELPRFALLRGINIQVLDVNTIFVPLVLQPSIFGFKDSITPALTVLATNPNTDPNDYVFWDDFHATTNVHKIAAGYFYTSLIFRGQFQRLLSVR